MIGRDMYPRHYPSHRLNMVVLLLLASLPVLVPLPAIALAQELRAADSDPLASASVGDLSSVKTVFIILFENNDWASITPSVAPYIRQTLVPLGAHAEQYFNPPGNHPSEPNYIWLEAGDNLGLTTDDDAGMSNSTSTMDHLVSYLENVGISWKAYQEGVSGTDCPMSSSGEYAAKHNPFVFFRDVTNDNDPNSTYCIAHIRPYSEFATDLQNNTVARYNFITPNLCNDMHDCDISTGDGWLSQEVPKILASQAYQDNGALFITWDEGDPDDGPIGMIVLSPLAKINYSNSIYYTHSSTLRTMQEIFGVRPFLRDAATAADLSDLFAETARAVMLGPAPGSILPDAAVTFSWSAGAGATQYWLAIGTMGVESDNVYSQSQETNLSVTASGLPVDGSTVYVRLWTQLGDVTGWVFNDYTYSATGSGGATLSVSPTSVTAGEW